MKEVYVRQTECLCMNVEFLSYLFGRFCFDELLINLLGSRGHSEWWFDLLVILTGEPELDILVAVFRFEKASKSSQSIWGNTKQAWSTDNTLFLASLKKKKASSSVNCHSHKHNFLFYQYSCPQGKSNLHLDSRSLSSDCDHCWVSSKLSLLGENAS